MTQSSRRNFLKNSAIGAAAITGATFTFELPLAS
jgi:hypothetical protein